MRVSITYGSNQTVSFTNVKSIANTDKFVSMMYEDSTAPTSKVTKEYASKDLGTYTVTIQPDLETNSNT